LFIKTTQNTFDNVESTHDVTIDIDACTLFFAAAVDISWKKYCIVGNMVCVMD